MWSLTRSNKDRLYVALYADNGHCTPPQTHAVQVANNIPQQNYIWGFCTSPKRETPGQIAGTCYRITWASGYWEFENLPLVHVHHTNANGTRLLARVLVGKVLNATALEVILGGSTIRQHVGWNYREWMADAMQRLRADTQVVLPESERVHPQAVTSLAPADWPHIRSVSRQFVRSRIAHGRHKGPFSANEPIPTYWNHGRRVRIKNVVDNYSPPQSFRPTAGPVSVLSIGYITRGFWWIKAQCGRGMGKEVQIVSDKLR